MPRGIPKNKEEKPLLHSTPEAVKEVKPEKPAKVHISPVQMKEMEDKAHLRDKPSEAERAKDKPQPGMKFFMAPDGTRIEGEIEKNRLWYRNLHGNNRGGWILPER